MIHPPSCQLTIESIALLNCKMMKYCVVYNDYVNNNKDK